ncbi:LytR/AlgR family response regulator transcription factor [Pseudoalteromonas denitrificans]|uniref:Two component transcriptional regulator, LytTR family n=1 Tax=Pseudoalteromonas denitrificans DSM 6059 TaxID=1123010 RepID=A0A1I1KZ31_9GAMM|nr:LytTR family DNA-binding domain-containing protein [Pseudoalteromonas denitrificans]SFC65552.1 two component transcriptional regulator, LytTR family [Pseudoalteromonas denitrificans DSM 6059]
MHIVIVEDEPVIAQRLKRQIGQILVAGKPIIKWFDDIEDASNYLIEHSIDLLMLDLNLHGENGFDLLKEITAQSFHTIIVSAYSEQAIIAFEYGVLDFVAKPFKYERLEVALSRFTDKTSHASHDLKQLAVKKHDGLSFIKISDISFIKADGHYTQLHYVKLHYTQLNLAPHDVALHDKSIDKLSMLLPKQFIRVHRSYIVNINKVKRLKIGSGASYQLLIEGEIEVPLSRSRYQEVKSLFS